MPQTVEIIINQAHKEGVYLLCTSEVCLVRLKTLRSHLQALPTTPNRDGTMEMRPNTCHILKVTIAEVRAFCMESTLALVTAQL